MTILFKKPHRRKVAQAWRKCWRKQSGVAKNYRQAQGGASAAQGLCASFGCVHSTFSSCISSFAPLPFEFLRSTLVFHGPAQISENHDFRPVFAFPLTHRVGSVSTGCETPGIFCAFCTKFARKVGASGVQGRRKLGLRLWALGPSGGPGLRRAQRRRFGDRDSSCNRAIY